MTLNISVFDFKNYKDYLLSILTVDGEGRGKRGKLARFIGCQSGFVSQVLGGHVNFSLEHALKINQFMDHSEQESDFFMLLVLKERAGSVDLENHFLKQINQILSKRSEVKERIKVNTELEEKDYLLYYSQWYYSAIHILCAIESFKTAKDIATRLKLSVTIVKDALDFLIDKSLVIETKNGLEIGSARIHIDRNSPLFIKHHTNWRLEGIKALENIKSENLHYSGVLALSYEDAKRIKEILLKSIEESEKILADSPEEALVSLSLDLFEV